MTVEEMRAVARQVHAEAMSLEESPDDGLLAMVAMVSNLTAAAVSVCAEICERLDKLIEKGERDGR